MKKLFTAHWLVLLCWIGSITFSFGQQLSYTPFYRHNWVDINPAAFPREYIEQRDMFLFFNLNARAQRVGVDVGAPRAASARTEWVFGSEQYASDHKVGIGLSLDEAGAIKKTAVKMSYAWMGALGEDMFFSLGGAVDYNNQHIQTDLVNWQTPVSFQDNQLNSNYFSFNMGGFLYHGIASGKEGGAFHHSVEHSRLESSYLLEGLSVSQVLSLGNTQNIKRVMQWNFILAAVLNEWELSSWTRYVAGVSYETFGFSLPVSVDLNLRYVFKFRDSPSIAGDQFWVGSGVNTAATCNFEVGYRRWVNTDLHFARYLQIGFAYTGLRLSSGAVLQPNDWQVNVGFNLAK